MKEKINQQPVSLLHLNSLTGIGKRDRYLYIIGYVNPLKLNSTGYLEENGGEYRIMSIKNVKNLIEAEKIQKQEGVTYENFDLNIINSFKHYLFKIGRNGNASSIVEN